MIGDEFNRMYRKAIATGLLLFFSYLLFFLCASSALLTPALILPGSSNSKIIFFLIGSTLGFVIPPKWLRFVAFAAILTGSWQLWKGHELSIEIENRKLVSASKAWKQCIVYGNDRSVNLSESFFKDVETFMVNRSYRRDVKWQGASEKYSKQGPPIVIVLVALRGYSPSAQHGSIDIYCNDPSGKTIEGLTSAFRASLQQKYTLKSYGYGKQ